MQGTREFSAIGLSESYPPDASVATGYNSGMVIEERPSGLLVVTAFGQPKPPEPDVPPTLYGFPVVMTDKPLTVRRVCGKTFDELFYGEAVAN